MDVTIVVDSLGPQLSGIGRYTWELCRRVPLEPDIERVGYFANGAYVQELDSVLDRRLPARNWLSKRLARHLAKRRLNRTLFFF